MKTGKSGWGLSARAYVGVQPDAQGLGRPQEAGDAVLDRRGLQPGLYRPLHPGDDALVAQQPDSGVIGLVAARRGLQRVTAMHAVPVLLDPGDHPFEFGAGRIVRHRPAVPVELVGLHAVHPVADRETFGGELDVPTAQPRAHLGLVRRLVLAELRPELLEQFAHWAQDLLLVDRLLAGPVRLRVVGLQALVELKSLFRPSAKGHVANPSTARAADTEAGADAFRHTLAPPADTPRRRHGSLLS